MIYKVLTRSSPSFLSLLRYIKSESKGLEINVLITHNVRANTNEGIVSEFIENESFRKSTRSNRTYVYHEILSMSANEDNTKITDEILKNIALKYISLRGKNGIYVGAIHRDKEHIHIHFMVGGTEFKTGKAFRLSKLDLRNLKINLQEYHKQKFPQITQSFPEHGSGRKDYVSDKQWQLEHRDERKSFKATVQKSVNECFAQAKTQKEFLDLLRDTYNLHFYERAGIATGLVLDSGMKIRFSRLGISREQFLTKPPDRAEELETLSRIRQLRDKNKSLSKDINR